MNHGHIYFGILRSELSISIPGVWLEVFRSERPSHFPGR
jgi:hypothetical protein